MHSLLTISEEVQRIYKRALGTTDNTKYVIDRRELYPIIVQVANEMLSLSIKSSMSVGEFSIPSHAISTYALREVQYIDGGYKAMLPYPPLNLPRNIGVWSVHFQMAYDAENYIYNDIGPLIPVGVDEWDLLKSTDIISSGNIENERVYYVDGPYLCFPDPPPLTQFGPDPLNQKRLVKIKLLVSNPDVYGESSPFPIPSDMVSTLVNKVLEILKMNTGGRQPEPKPQDR
jgi:hypothetical protein